MLYKVKCLLHYYSIHAADYNNRGFTIQNFINDTAIQYAHSIRNHNRKSNLKHNLVGHMRRILRQPCLHAIILGFQQFVAFLLKEFFRKYALLHCYGVRGYVTYVIIHNRIIALSECLIYPQSVLPVCRRSPLLLILLAQGTLKTGMSC